MHKQQAAELFNVLGDPDRVKMMKFLCVQGTLTAGELFSIVGIDENKFLKDCQILKENELINIEENNDGILISANRKLVDDLLAFIVTPCGCSHK